MWQLVLALAASASAFNVDTINYIKHRGNPGSMFGFSVAAHREQANSWVLVGAPEAQTSQPGVTKAGAVYRCDIARDDACSLIEFDTKGDNNNSEGNKIDMKSHQWFGATVRSSGQDGIILACAPRYVWFTNHLNRRDPVGTCYTARNQFTEFAEYSPCRTRNWGYHRQGSCQAGLGASLSRDGSRIYMGAVGSWYWQGQLHSLDSLARLPFVPPRHYSILEEGQVISQHAHARPDVISTREGPSADDDSYLGYSVTVGDFGGGSGGYNDAAVGMPRGAGLLGKVVLYSWNMTNLHNLTGEQLGAYFGYSLCSGDIDGDGLDDLIVGAPMYTDLSNNKGHYETGRVYIMYQGGTDYLFKNLHVRDGVNSKSRFGLALTSLGDINLDGYGDFAVGAPYDGPKEKGAVYIFHGSKRGALEKPSQVIYAEQVAGQPSTFGFSLAGGLDLDENLYPDMIVGAYESDTAIFLRSRPVVQVESNFSFLSQSKQISLEEKNCTLRDRTRVTCTELNTCLQYSGTGVDRRVEFEIQFVLDSKKPRNPRMFFLTEEGRNVMNQTIRLDKNSQYCKKMLVYIKPNIRDKLTTLEAEMKYSLKGSQPSATRRVARTLSPVLDMNRELSKKDSILIQKDCGRDNICIPDLRLIAIPSVTQYLLGSGEKLAINVTVQNEGEDAFEAVYELQIPSGLNYVKIDRTDVGKEIPVLCSPPSYLNNNTLHCDIGNPLPKRKTVQFRVLLQPYRLENLKPRYQFYMVVNSTNPENESSMSDNQMEMIVPIWVETDLILQGSSQKSEVYYNATQYQFENITLESQIGPQVNHIYSIRNKGPSDIVEAEAYFLWPSYTLSGDHLLYLLEQPEISGNVRCEIVEEVNVEKIKIERRGKGAPAEGSSVHSSLTSESGYSSSSSFSSSSSSGSGSWRSKDTLSAEERRRLEEAERRQEEVAGESGDASERHKQRVSQAHYSSNGGRLESDSRLGSQGYDRSWSREGSWSSGGSGQGRQGYNRSWSKESSHSSSGGSEDSAGGTRVNIDGGRSSHGYNRSWSSESSWSSGGRGVHPERSKVEAGSESSNRHSGQGYNSWGNENSFTVSGGRGGSGGYKVEVIGKPVEINSGYNKSLNREHSWADTSQAGSSNREDSRDRLRSESSYTGTEFRQDSRNRGSTQDLGLDSSREISLGEGSSGFRGSEISITSLSGYRGSSSKESSSERTWNVDESPRGTGITWSSGSSRHSGNRTPTTHFEERNYEKNTTWTSADRKPQVSTSWSINRDGIIESGRHQGEYDSNADVETKDESYFGGNSRGRNASWMVTDAHKQQGGGHDYRGHSPDTGRRRNFTEERHFERNSTWNSRGSPITSESTSWTVNEDGNIRNRSSNRVYHGISDDGISDHKLHITLDGNSKDSIDHNLLQGGKFYSEEKEMHQNTTWSSGRRPVTHESRHWRTNDDGIIRNGSTSRVYESNGREIDGSHSRASEYSGVTSGSREYDSNRRVYNLGSNRGHGSDSGRWRNHTEERHTEKNTTWNSGGKPITSESVSWTTSEDGVIRNGSSSRVYHGSADEDIHNRRRIGGVRQETSRHQEDHHSRGHSSQDRSSSRTDSSHRRDSVHGVESSDRVSSHAATNINIGDLLNSKHSNQGFDALGSIAQGPRDGVARTHTLDLGILNSRGSGENTQSSSHSSSGSRSQGGGSYSSNAHRSQSSYTGGSSGNRQSYAGEHSSGSTYSGSMAGGMENGHSVSSGAQEGSYGGSTSSHNHHHSVRVENSGSGRGSHYGSSGGFSARHNDDEGDLSGSSYDRSWSSGRRTSGGGSRSWSYSSTSGTADGDTTRHGGMYAPRTEQHSSDHLSPRYRRQIDYSDDLESELHCGPTKCTRIKCLVGPLKKDEEALITFKSRVWVQTLLKQLLVSEHKLTVSSLLVARVSKLPHIGRPDVVETRTHEVFTQVVPWSSPGKPEVVPLWVVVLSACAGALLLMLLVFLLYKCGFFKRNRPSTSPEKQPLNRNGHYQPGDEAL